MTRQLYYTFLCFISLFVACADSNNTLTAEEVLDFSIKNSGGDTYLNSHIKFNVGDLDYHFYRHKNIIEYQLTRVVGSMTYLATYHNGQYAYLVNDQEQIQTTQSRKFIETQLDGFAYAFYIPHLFNENHVLTQRLDDVKIDKKDYYTLRITFKDYEGSPNDQFYLYINKDTGLVDFYTEKMHINGDSNLFKKALNWRERNGLMFADYHIFKSADTVPLEDVYKYYNNKTIEYVKATKIENIIVNPIDSPVND